MKLRDLKRARHLGWRDIANKSGIFASFLLVTVLSLYAWSPAKESSAFDWNTVDGTSPYIASLSGNDEIRISATPSASQAVFDQDDTLELTSTCPYGAAIYLNMDSSESNALSRTGTDEGIKTISATTGTALNDNSWGYSLDDGSTYLPMPLNTGTPVNIYNSEQVESNTEITVKYGMKIDSSIPSGYYSGNVLYSTVANPSCARYTLSFDTDGGTEIDDIQLTYGQLIDLAEYETTKDGYSLTGWELVGTDTTFAADDEDVNVNPDDELNVTLKAKWEKTEVDFFAIETMQEMSDAVCNAATTPDSSATELDIDGSHKGDPNYVPQITLIDTRDNNSYRVRKLADGNCWMTENLRLKTATLTPEDSDVSSNYNLSQYSTYNNNTSYGSYYTWAVATAGSPIVGGEAQGSICPKGWRLPIRKNGVPAENTADKSFERLMWVYGVGKDGATIGYDLEKTPLDFVYNGHLNPNSNQFAVQGTNGSYWSSTEKTSTEAGALYYYNNSDYSYITNSNSYLKNGRLTVRCVNMGSMQEFDESTLPAGQTTRLVDERDGNTYTVRKLADGNVWMTQNLRIVDTVISDKDSDLPAGKSYTIPASDLTKFHLGFETNSVYYDSEYGGFYNFYTATAGWGDSGVDVGDNAPQSICPKGWHLPTGGTGSDFERLITHYGTLELIQGDPAFEPGGYVFDGEYSSKGSSAGYWASDIEDYHYVYYLGFISRVTIYSGNLVEGHNVRCVAYKSMQNFRESQLEAGQSTRLIDKRDDEIYTVTKLADGKVWMTENLRVAGKTLTRKDSDYYLDESFELPGHNWSNSGDRYSLPFVYETGNKEYGVYYNVPALTTGQIYGQTSSITSKNSSMSVCPRNWRLPMREEFTTLLTTYNVSNDADGVAILLDTPLNFLYSGTVAYTAASVPTNQGTAGQWWSASYSSNRYRYSLQITESTARALTTQNNYGAPARCVAEERFGVTLDPTGGELSTNLVVVSNGSPAGLPSPTKAGWGFAGWYTSAEGGELVDEDNDTWTSDITLYAHWIVPVGIHTITTMQEMTSTLCSETTTPSVGADRLDPDGGRHGNTRYAPRVILTDTRDNEEYTVTKLADGRCWMTNKSLTISGTTITSEDSDIPSGSYTIPDVNWTTATAESDRYVNPYVLMYTANNKKVAGLYNYVAATAGQIASTTNTAEATRSICPKGWKMPSATEGRTFLNTYGVTDDSVDATFLINDPVGLSGKYWISAQVPSSGIVQTNNNTFWTTTYAGTVGVRNGISTSYNSKIVRISTSSANYGYRIRCVARN